jgi:dihydroorotate dehydrogenase
LNSGISKVKFFLHYPDIPTVKVFYLYRAMYKWLRSLLFLFPPEFVHHFSMAVLNGISALGPGRYLLRRLFSLNDPSLENTLAGIPCKNTLGLAAGFDKNALFLQPLETLGFGIVEIGTVTPLPQSGNPRPRLFRLKKDQALINRMGFNNHGVDQIARRLEKWKNKSSPIQKRLVIGGNIGKNKITPNENAWQDYGICFEKLFPWVDYFVVNVSSPNTPGLRELQEKESLRKIFIHLQSLNKKNPQPKPLFLKISPDLTGSQLDDVIELALEIQLSGLVVSNTTIGREELKTSPEKLDQAGSGGLSGKPLRQKSTDMIRYIHEKTNHGLLLIGSGGISSAEDALEKMQAGAKGVQVWTGFIYQGPAIAKKILKGILKNHRQ